MKLIALIDFSWAHRGCDVEVFAKGQPIETEDADLIRVSLEEGWTEDGDAKARAAAQANQQPQEQLDMAAAEQQAPADMAEKPAQNKARKGAPETK